MHPLACICNTGEKFATGNSLYWNLTCTFFFFFCNSRTRNVHAPGICHQDHAHALVWQLYQKKILEITGFFKKKRSLPVRKGKASLKKQNQA